MVYTLAKVADDKLDAIQALEEEIGAPLLAMSEVDVQPARLDRGKLSRIQSLEQELGVVLVAVNN